MLCARDLLGRKPGAGVGEPGSLCAYCTGFLPSLRTHSCANKRRETALCRPADAATRRQRDRGEWGLEGMRSGGVPNELGGADRQKPCVIRKEHPRIEIKTGCTC